MRSGQLENFIIKMYTKNIGSAVKYHATSAENNSLLFANSIANKIEDDKIREDTLSEICKRIILSKDSSTK